MSVSGASPAANPFTKYIQNQYKPPIHNVEGLGGAVQSGDLSTAQTALTALQKDIQKNPQGTLATALADPNSQISKDFQALQTALQSNDAAGAQTAFAALAQDLKSIHHQHHRHHHKTEGESSQVATDGPPRFDTSSLVGVNLNEAV